MAARAVKSAGGPAGPRRGSKKASPKPAPPKNSSGRNSQDIAEYQRQVITTILHILGNLRHSGMEILSEVELSYPQILVLYALLEKGSVTIGELARHLKVSQGVASRTVDRMVDKGLLDRVRDEDDRRVVHVTLSGDGRDFAMHMISYHAERLESQFSETGEKDREVFLRLLRQIDDGLEKAPREG